MSWLLILSFNAFATWSTVDFFPQSWDDKRTCEQLGNSECFEIQESEAKYKVSTIQVDDASKPVYSAKSNAVACSSWQDCLDKKPVCVEPYRFFIAQDFSEVYCAQINSYEKKDKQVIVYDNLKASEYAVKKAQEVSDKAAKDAKKDKIKAALKKAIKKEDNTLTNSDLDDL
jgi:membrane-associated HD superfamily phosphohydrolase